MHTSDELLLMPDAVAVPARPAAGHKGTFGRVAVVAGAPPTGAPPDRHGRPARRNPECGSWSAARSIPSWR